MSSWYVLSALGIYAVTPGTDQYVIGSPVFRKATITMEDGKQFVIEAADNNKDNVYIQHATLNGKPLDKNYITYGDIVLGGTLSLQIDGKPAQQRAKHYEGCLAILLVKSEIKRLCKNISVS